MKRYIYILKQIVVLSLLLGGFACDDFLSKDPSLSLDTEMAFTTPSDYNTAIIGIYYTLGQDKFLGRSQIAFGDVASDLVVHNNATQHFQDVYSYQILTTNIYIDDIWAAGYEAVDRATRLIVSAPVTLAEGTWSNQEKAIVYRSVAQAYAVKALTSFYLVNMFGLPYSDENKSSLGVVFTEVPVGPDDVVQRISVEDSYLKIQEYIQKAKDSYAEVEALGEQIAVPKSQLNLAAVYALESRVKLYMKDYSGSISAAEEALKLLPDNAMISDKSAYAAMYTTLNVGTEEIFYIAKSEQDYLSANSINTLYGKYGVSIMSSFFSNYDDNDIRKAFLAADGGKYVGANGNNQMSNIPILRLPELYLNMAESYAKLAIPQYDKAKSNLLEVLSNRVLGFDASTIAEDASIVDVIFDERAKELIQEGHRFFDLRRTGKKADVTGGTKKDFEIYNFVYPIPAAEVNSGAGVVQTEGWDKNLPK